MYYQTKTGVPSAYITKDKKRLKQFGQNVYLKNGEEFELELFNPSSTTVLAKIKLDGSYISGGGIVLKPGQRVYLERYLDDPRKFKFETYEVDGTSSEVLDAISSNGDVVVEFFNESQPPVWVNNITYGGVIGGTYNPCYVGATLTTNIGDSLSFNDTSLNINYSNHTLTKETGRVEKGGISNQSFQTVNKSFDYYSITTSIWKILPMSEKVYEKQELKVYCGNCGTKKRRDSHKFCPNCGEKY